MTHHAYVYWYYRNEIDTLRPTPTERRSLSLEIGETVGKSAKPNRLSYKKESGRSTELGRSGPCDQEVHYTVAVRNRVDSFCSKKSTQASTVGRLLCTARDA